MGTTEWECPVCGTFFANTPAWPAAETDEELAEVIGKHTAEHARARA
jgi:hypothetical protein